MSTPPTFRLVLRSLPSKGPVEVRLRRALKCLQRAFGLKCIRVEEVPVEAATQKQPASERSKK
jgi:hypothetical protein